MITVREKGDAVNSIHTEDGPWILGEDRVSIDDAFSYAEGLQMQKMEGKNLRAREVFYSVLVHPFDERVTVVPSGSVSKFTFPPVSVS